MHSIVSLLDAAHTLKVKELWGEVADEFSVRGMYQMTVPHLCYHMAEDYDWEKLKLIMPVFARALAPFRITSVGLGVFTGAHPSLYMPVVRNQELSELHEELWEAVEDIASRPLFSFSPGKWMPHIVLARKDLRHDDLPAIVRKLSERDLVEHMTINNLSLIYDKDGRHQLRIRYDFKGKGAEPERPERIRQKRREVKEHEH